MPFAFPTATVVDQNKTRTMANDKTLHTACPLGARPRMHTKLPVPRLRSISAGSLHKKANKQSPGRGLTVRIDDAIFEQTIQSAPVRTIRPLPVAPSAPYPSPSDSRPTTPDSTPLSSSSSMSTPKQTDDSHRTLRPLPCPPPLTPAFNVVLTPPTTPSHDYEAATGASSRAGSPPHMERATRVAKPLPVPEPKSRISRRIPTRSLSSCNRPQVVKASTNFKSAPQPHSAVTSSNKDMSFSTSSSSGNSSDDDGSGAAGFGFDDLSTTPRQNRFLAVRDGRRRVFNNDSDMTSEDDDDQPFSSRSHGNRVASDQLEEEDEEEERQVDYAWILSNRVLYKTKQQDPTSKWVREKKGKRITEADYTNIMHALRNL